MVRLSVTGQLGVIIGVSTIKIFVLFVNPTFLRSLGAQFIASCGFAPILAR